MEKRYCRFCAVEHPATSEFWYRNGAYFKCRNYFRARSKERIKKVKALTKQARWVPKNWAALCATLLDQVTEVYDRRFVWGIKRCETLTEKQWALFCNLYIRHVGEVNFRLSTKKETSFAPLPVINESQITRFKSGLSGSERLWVDTDDFLHRRKKPKDVGYFHR
jgi:hypothetical protein